MRVNMRVGVGAVEVEVLQVPTPWRPFSRRVAPSDSGALKRGLLRALVVLGRVLR